jgi:hypothetical protein
VDRAFSGIIRLRDTDGSIGTTDRRGYRVDIGWGFATSSGNIVSYSEPMFVYRQATIATEGDVYAELVCVSLWDLLGADLQSISTSTRLKYNVENTTTIDTSIRRMILAAIGSALSVVVSYDGCNYTDFSVEAASVAEDDVDLLPANPQVGSAVYFGHVARFNRLSIDLTVPDGDQAGVWEYWDGCAWETLPGLDDNTSGLQTGELKIVAWTNPGSLWVAVDLNAVELDCAFPEDELYYVRFRVTSAGVTCGAISATLVYGSLDYALALDSTAGQFQEDLMPSIIVNFDVDRRRFVQALLHYTGLGIIVKQDGFHLVRVDPDECSTVYDYDSTHVVYQINGEQSHILPNNYIYVAFDPAIVEVSGVTQLEGSASDSSSVAAFGNYFALVIDESIGSDCEADVLAANAIERDRVQSNKGFIIAPMNCGQELWDYVSVEDTWISCTTWNGHVTQLIRTFEPGVYNIEITLGGISRILEQNSIYALRELERRQENLDIQQQMDTSYLQSISDSTGTSLRALRVLREQLGVDEFNRRNQQRAVTVDALAQTGMLDVFRYFQSKQDTMAGLILQGALTDLSGESRRLPSIKSLQNSFDTKSLQNSFDTARNQGLDPYPFLPLPHDQMYRQGMRRGEIDQADYTAHLFLLGTLLPPMVLFPEVNP